MKYKYIIIQSVLLLLSFSVLSQTPNWTVNPSQYDMSMVYTVVLKFSGNESRNENDKIGAFSGNKLVGVASPVVYVSSQDRYEANLIIYSNQDNVPITFKIYNAQKDIISDALNEVVFSSDARVGTVAEPYVISDEQLDGPALLYNNIITPNSDGFNDFLVIQDIDSYTENELSVYDMNWTKVYHTKNYQNDWSGSELSRGEYYLYFVGNFKNHGRPGYKGRIKIVK